MGNWLQHLAVAAADTLINTAPILVVLIVFWLLAIRKPVPHPKRLLLGSAYVLGGLTLFIVGLDQALFPLGKVMAEQLTSPEFLGASTGTLSWTNFYWVYAFAAAIGFATTIAEPALITVALKANEVSAGAIGLWGLRIAVGLGVGIGVAVGTIRIVTGAPLPIFIMVGYGLIMVQTFRARRSAAAIIPLAFDSGGVATSTVTVPVLAALGLGLATAIPGRDPLMDGFGLIAFACLFPIITVIGYAQLAAWRQQRTERRNPE